MRPAIESDYVPASDERRHTQSYANHLVGALRSGVDVWGQEVLAHPEGPTLSNLKDYLVPSFLADPIYQTPVPYLPLSHDPDDDSYALHVIDGSHIIVEGLRNWLILGAVLPNGEETELLQKPARVAPNSPRYHFEVGYGERFGERLDRLNHPKLLDGFLPALQLNYVDGSGVRWLRESFASRPDSERPLTSWLRFTATTESETQARLAVRVDADFGPLTVVGNAVVAAGGTVLRASVPIDLDGNTAVLRLSDAPVTTVDLAIANTPDAAAGTSVGSGEYESGRTALAGRWNELLNVPTSIEVPERDVMDAMRNLLIQNLTLGHRYSVGNPYERTFTMDAHLSIQPLLWYGFPDRHREQLLKLSEVSNGSGADWYESWERGAKLSAAAEHSQFTGDKSVLIERFEAHREYLDSMTDMARNDPLGLLAPERFAWDIPDVVYSLHGQAVAWRGMLDILAAYRRIGHPIADEYEPAVRALGDRIREAIERVAVELPDGSVFVPNQLESDPLPFKFLPSTRLGNYWNLRFPSAMTSGILSTERLRQILAYMDGHGAFFLGLTRFSGLYEPIPEQGDVHPDGTAGYKVAGIDCPLAIQHMRVLADLEEADRVVLLLYSKLAHGMTRGTFLDGEGTTLGVVPGEYFRSSWYPPNSQSNALYLLTLRTILAHEHYDDDAALSRLVLAPSVPRGWLEHGKSIVVRDLPTRIGQLSYKIESVLEGLEPRIEVSINLDPSRPEVPVHLCLRAPVGWHAQGIEGPDSGHTELQGDRVLLDPRHHNYQVTVQFAREHSS